MPPGRSIAIVPGLQQVNSQFLGRATLYDVFHFGVGFVFLVVGAIGPGVGRVTGSMRTVDARTANMDEP